MKLPILVTKLFIPSLQAKTVLRQRLIEKLNEGAKRKLTLVSASAGFGKTLLLSQWIENYNYSVAWISLDQEHNDITRFLIYLLGALQSIDTKIGEAAVGMLLSSQTPSFEAVMTVLINDIANLEDDFSLVLDDYHSIDSAEVDKALVFLLENMPSQMHLIISTREDPRLPIAKLRAIGQLVEIRVLDMRFTQPEAAEFLNQTMDLKLPDDNISALELRTEGWIAGLQLAAISMKGTEDISGFIESFTGSNRYIIDYLVEEVLNKQPKNVQEFLLRTSVLDRMCGSLCDEVFPENDISGQETLEYLEKTNMFIIPLDEERKWYRYHHLFAELLQQRLFKSKIIMSNNGENNVATLHLLASQWYEKDDDYVEAFKHAAVANDVERAERLIKGNGIPLQFLGALIPILNWLSSLKKEILDAKPSLWVTYASTLSIMCKFNEVEEKLLAAEAALEGKEENAEVRNLIGQIASNRGFLAFTQRKPKIVLSQTNRALKYLHPDNVAVRTSAKWLQGGAYHYLGDLDAASDRLKEAISISQVSGNFIVGISAASELGEIQEEENQLYLAEETYQYILKMQGNMPLPASACFSHSGLARIFYEWNDLEKAFNHCQKSIELAPLLVNTDISVICEVFLARLKITDGDYMGAMVILEKANKTIQHNGFVERIPDVIATEVLALIKQGEVKEADNLANKYNLPISQARVSIANGDGVKAIEFLEPLNSIYKNYANKILEVFILMSIANQMIGNSKKALSLLGKAIELGKQGKYIRKFIDEGAIMADLLSRLPLHGIKKEYRNELVSAQKAEKLRYEQVSLLTSVQPQIEQLSKREFEVLYLIAQGCSNREICEKLFLALDTVKGHNRRIYGKLGVNNRTMAIREASDLGILKMQ